MPRIYVLDTNVLLHNPKSLFVFEEHEVVIPNWVLEEVDKFKSDQTVLGFNARTTGRYLDKMRERGSLKTGVPLNGGGTLRVDWDGDLNTEPPSSMDNAILKTAQRLRVTNLGHQVVLVSRDINMRVKADALGILAENYRHDQAAEPDKQYTGYQEVDCLDQDVENFYAGIQPEAGLLPDNLNVHEFVHLKGTSKSSALARWDGSKLVRLPKSFDVWKIKPRNREQSFAFDLLMNPDIKLITLSGLAGSGKTLAACAAGLQQVCDQQIYTRMTVARPVIPMGKDIGYLPGDLNSKLAPWMQPIFDNLEVLLPGKPGADRGSSDASYQHLIDRGMLQVEALTYIRGRSIPNQFILIDECFPYSTPILTEDGTKQIGAMFGTWTRNVALPRVRSFDTETKTFVWKKITNMWHRGVKPLVEIRASNRKLRCTKNHPILTTNGWVPAGKLVSGDMLIASHPDTSHVLKVLNTYQEQIFLGSFLGDGSMDCYDTNKVRMSETHGMPQEAYSRWKAAQFNAETYPMLNSGYNPEEPKICFNTPTYGYVGEFPCPKTTCPQHVLDNLDIRGLAIWFMDDGHAFQLYNGATFHTESFDVESISRMMLMLNRFGIDCVMSEHTKGFVIRLLKDAYVKLSEMVAPYMHPNLEYKVHPDHKHMIGEAVWESTEPEYGVLVVKKVVEIDNEEHVFDMEVEDTHNFLVPATAKGENRSLSGIVCHNCQNLSNHEVKTIISRCGEGTKIVLTGDPAQIDNPYVDARSNGLTYVQERFKDSKIAGHVTLSKGERSQLSEEATQRL